MKIIIDKTEDQGWRVECDGKWSDMLASGEVIETVARLVLLGGDTATCLRTEEYWAENRRREEARRRKHFPTEEERQQDQKLLTDQAERDFPNVRI